MPANVRFIRLMCTGRIDPEFVMKGFNPARMEL